MYIFQLIAYNLVSINRINSTKKIIIFKIFDIEAKIYQELWILFDNILKLEIILLISTVYLKAT